MLTHTSLPGTLPTCLPRASCPSEISCGCSQATRTAALSLCRGTAPGAAVHRDRLSNSYTTGRAGTWSSPSPQPESSSCTAAESEEEEEEGFLGVARIPEQRCVINHCQRVHVCATFPGRERKS